MAKQPGMIDPQYWLTVANERSPKLSFTTDWISGEEAPVRVGCTLQIPRWLAARNGQCSIGMANTGALRQSQSRTGVRSATIPVGVA